MIDVKPKSCLQLTSAFSIFKSYTRSLAQPPPFPFQLPLLSVRHADNMFGIYVSSTWAKYSTHAVFNRFFDRIFEEN